MMDGPSYQVRVMDAAYKALHSQRVPSAHDLHDTHSVHVDVLEKRIAARKLYAVDALGEPGNGYLGEHDRRL